MSTAKTRTPDRDPKGGNKRADARMARTEHRKLRKLSLAGLGLKELPDSIQRLTWLTSLNVSQNALTTLPDFVGELRQLQDLDVSSNDITELPQALSHLQELRTLNVGANKLSFLPSAIGSLQNLRQFSANLNAVTALPPQFALLDTLEILDVGNNKLAEVPEWIEDLERLVTLRVFGNPLGKLPNEIGGLSQLVSLDASKCGLETVPLEIKFMRALQELYLHGNLLRQIPDALCSLSSLRSLILSNNCLESLPNEIGNLSSLLFLALDGNPALEELPESVGRLHALRGLALMGTGQVRFWTETRSGWMGSEYLKREFGRLRALPESIRGIETLTELYLHDQPLLGLPPEVLGPTWDEAKRRATSSASTVASRLDYYFNTRISRPLNEAKMILVGRGGVGKTSLVNRLVSGTYDKDEAKTDGIAITPWTVQLGSDNVRLNIWDFGGQEIMHATHQFFLTKRSLYLLVLNAREGEQDANIEYWLQLIESFAADSPVLIAINKIQEHRFDLNRRGLLAKYPSVRGFVQTDCESSEGIDELRKAIMAETNRLPHLRDPFPQTWFAIKDALSNLPATEKRNFISYGRYQDVCSAHGVTDSRGQETLVGFLHDLGIVVNFRDDPRLSETHVLNPAWVTNGIYTILNARQVADSHGELSLPLLAKLLNSSEYPKQMHLYLLDLMRKFELCYEFYEASGTYLIPELLGKEQPELSEFVSHLSLRFEYVYDIIPEGLLPRFIVRSRALNRDLPRWRTGVVLKWENNRALVAADLRDRKISVVVIGDVAGRRRLLTVIRADLDQIHRSIAKLHAVEQVPLPSHPGVSVSFEDLQVLEAEGESDVRVVHGGKVVRVPITELLDGVDPSTSRSRASSRFGRARGTASVVFSYSHKDEELRDQLEVHLKLLQRQGIITTWHDRKVVAGDTWADVLDENFRRADICLVLVSADFIASDYCYEIEAKTMLERHAKAECRLIPIVVRACDWEDSPFGKIQALPRDGRPVTSWSNVDEAWNDVARGIKKAAKARSVRTASTS